MAKSAPYKAAGKLRMKMSIKLLSALIITAILLGSLFATDTINGYLNLRGKVTDESAYTGGSDINVVKDGKLVVHFLDVGQGDCTLINLPDGKTMIVDAGKSDNKVGEKINGYIEESFGTKFEVFDYAILTHSDEDHCGSFAKVLAKYPARTIYRPNIIASAKGFTDPGKAVTDDGGKDSNEKFYNATGHGYAGVRGKDTIVYKDFVEAAYKASQLVPSPRVIVSDGRRGSDRPAGKGTQDITGDDGDPDGQGKYSVQFYSPQEYTYPTDWNNYSNIFMLSYRGKKIMISGDAEQYAEQQFAVKYGSQAASFNVDVIKLGHHGSKTSSREDYLGTIANDTGRRKNIYTIASCGLKNSYGHPHAQMLERLENMGFDMDKFLRTDLNGDIVFSVRQESPGGAFALYHGAEAVRIVTGPAVEWLDWFEIAIAIWIVSMFFIFAVVKTSKAKGGRKKAAASGK